MANYGQLISVLLEHSQRFLDFWNLQLVIALGVIGFCIANQKIVSRISVRLMISLVFISIAIFSVFSLGAHQTREIKLWNALEAHVAATPGEFLPEDSAYIDSLKPTSFTIKAGAIIAADLLVILVVWFSPMVAEKPFQIPGTS
jgi:uncharacterized membrane protein